MKKFTGRYTTEAPKALKGSEKIVCHVAAEDDGTGNIYVTNGYFLWKMNPPEYAACVQPVTCCEPGEWIIDRNGKQDNSMNLEKIFSDALKTVADAAPLARAPFVLQTDKAAAACYYNAADDFSALYNVKYISALAGSELRTVKTISPAVAYYGGEPYALVFPIKPKEEAARAIKAYFTAAPAATESSDAAALRDELNIAQSKIASLMVEIARQNADLAQLREAKTEQPQQPAEQKPAPQTAAEIIAARWAEVDGLTVTVKGAQTAAPVVWLAGDTKPHGKEIEAAGGKWSGKKNAYYFRVA